MGFYKLVTWHAQIACDLEEISDLGGTSIDENSDALWGLSARTQRCMFVVSV